jgi:two-component system chemotaxis response regulator CheY
VLKFLIVDDDAVCRELLKDILSAHGECDLAYDGAEAIDAVRLALEDNAPYDLVCLDIMMPGTSGHDALQAIRQIEARYGVLGSDGVKIIMTTALRDPKHCIAAFREGCESYVTKPIREEQLLAMMRQLGLLRAAPNTTSCPGWLMAERRGGTGILPVPLPGTGETPVPPSA